MSSKHQRSSPGSGLVNAASVGALFTAIAAVTHGGSELVKLTGITVLVGFGVAILLHHWRGD